VRVLICDREVIFAEALASLLIRHGCETVTCADPLLAPLMVAHHDVEVCITELSFGDWLGGIDVILAVREVKPETRVVVLSSRSDPELVAAAKAAGAKSFLLKAHGCGVARKIFDSLTRNGFVLQDPPASSGRKARGSSRIRQLTRREYQVLQHLVNGETAPVIAEQLGISYATARTYVQRVLEKLGVHTRLEAGALASSEGLKPRGKNRAFLPTVR